MNRTPSPDSENQPEALVKKLTECVSGLADLAIELREALVHRKPDRIWDILARQEEQAVLLEQYCRLWKDLTAGESTDKAGSDPLARQIRSQLERLRALQQSNAILAHSFLSGVRKSLAHIGQRLTGAPTSYSAQGRTENRQGSRLLHYKG